MEIFLHLKPLCGYYISSTKPRQTITKYFSKINTKDTEIYILGDFNINLFSKKKYIFHQKNTQLMSHEVKN